MKKVARSLVVVLLAMSLLVGCSKTMDSKRILEIDALFDKGEYEQALTLATEYVEDYPDHYLGWREMGWINLKLDEHDTAKSNFEKAIELNADDDNAYVGLGATYRQLGNYEKAREQYLKALEIEENNPEALGSLIVVELYEGELDSAIEHGEKAWELSDPKNPVLAANLSVVYHYAENYDKRDEYFQQAKDLGYLSIDTLQQIFDGEIEIEIKQKDQ